MSGVVSEERDYIAEVIAEDALARNAKRLSSCPAKRLAQSRGESKSSNQEAKDKLIRAALVAEFNDAAIADRVMRVIKEQRT